MKYIDFQVLKTLFIAGCILIVLDATFLYLTKDAFEIQVASVQRVSIQPKYLGFIICYFFLILGLYWFILRTHRPILEAVLLGFVIYGVYESTNYSIFKKWKIQTLLTDTLWGGALMGLTTNFTYMLC